jgi:hypothetical protein
MLFKNSKHDTFVFVRLFESQSTDSQKKDSLSIFYVMQKNQNLHATFTLVELVTNELTNKLFMCEYTYSMELLSLKVDKTPVVVYIALTLHLYYCMVTGTRQC